MVRGRNHTATPIKLPIGGGREPKKKAGVEQLVLGNGVGGIELNSAWIGIIGSLGLGGKYFKKRKTGWVNGEVQMEPEGKWA